MQKSEHVGVGAELSRELTLFHVTMMGLGMMIGAGVFIGIGNAIGIAGPGGLLLTFALNGLIAMFTAMSYAELSSAIPRAGGAYNFARIGFGRGPAFLGGWMEWFASSVAGSLYAYTLAIYTLRCLVEWGVMGAVSGLPGMGWFGLLAEPGAARTMAERVVASAVALIFLHVNMRGASETGKIGAVFTLGQTLFLIVVGIIGVVVALFDPSRLSNFTPFMPNGWGRLLVTMGFTYVAFEGYEVIAQAGDEVIDPKKNLPKAMLLSVLIVTVTYVLVSFAAVVAVKAGSDGVGDTAPWEWIGAFGPEGFGAAVGRLIPVPWLSNLILTLAVLFAATSALNATIYSATRASFAMGRDRMLPPFFARISPRRRSPWVALLFTGGLVISMALFLPILEVASCASIMFLFLFLLVNLCAIKIRRNMGDELEYGYRMPLFPLFPVLAILFQLFMAYHLHEASRLSWIIAPSWVGLGLLIYLGYSRQRVQPSQNEVFVLEETRPMVAEGYRIMVAVANPANARDLLKTTYRLCGAKDASVELTHVVPVPVHVPLAEADKHMRTGREGIIEVMKGLGPEFSIGTNLRYCRNIARGILMATKEKRTNLLVMGWRGHPHSRRFRLGSTIDPIIERAPCRVVLTKGCNATSYKRVLVATSGGPNGGLAFEIASILTDEEEGELTLFAVGQGHNLAGFVEENRNRLAIPMERVQTREVNARDVVGAILREAREHDLLVIGCTRVPLLRRLRSLPIPERVARNCPKPLVMVNVPGYIQGWLNRWV